MEQAQLPHRTEAIFTSADGITFYGGGKNRVVGGTRCHHCLTLRWVRAKPCMVLSHPKTTPLYRWFSCAKYVGSSEPEPLFIHLDFPDFGIHHLHCFGMHWSMTFVSINLLVYLYSVQVVMVALVYSCVSSAISLHRRGACFLHKCG